MRVAYLAHWNDGPQTGVWRKMTQQVLAWQDMECEVRLFLSSTSGDALSWPFPAPPRVALHTRGFKSRARAVATLARSIEAWKPDVVYVRQDVYYPAMGGLTSRFAVVVEVNSDDVSERRLGSLVARGYNTATRGRLYGTVDGLVFVSTELSLRPSFAGFIRPFVVIGNGIDLKSVPALPAASPDGRLTFAAMGSPGQTWQGFDEIAELASALPDSDFFIIGSVAPTRTSSPNLRFLGHLDTGAYREVLACAHVGIGTAALFRTGLNEASPLKTREFLAHGLPVVTAYRDTDFPDAPPFLLQLPNEAGSLVRHAEAIRSFAEGWRSRRVLREAIRHLDSLRKERLRLDFLRDVGEGGGVAEA